jgi:hypothetical protein
MREVYSKLFVGDDTDYEKVKDNPDWRVLRCAKDGPGGHREVLGYQERSAPKGPTYLFVEKPRKLILNMVDSHDPRFFPDPMVSKALAFISDSLSLGHKILVCCNHGASRSPSIALMWLVKNGKLPPEGAVRKFKQLYPNYDPSPGIKIFTKQRIAARR